MGLELAELGLSLEELQDRVVERLCDNFLHKISVDDEGNGYQLPSELQRKLHAEVERRIAESISLIGEQIVLPKVKEMIEQTSLQETNRWGEKRKEPLTFTEYLEKKASEYITEKVDYEGKSEAENRYGTWNGRQTRVAFMVHQHLQYTIKSIIENILSNANTILVDGLATTCKLKLEEIGKSLKVKVETKS